MAASPQSIQTAHSKLPPAIRLTFNDCLVLFYVEQHRNAPYCQWPTELKMPKVVDKLRRRDFVHRGYFPTNYSITRTGFSLVKWIRASIEHTNANLAAVQP